MQPELKHSIITTSLNDGKNVPDMAINGTGVNEAIAIVLKAAKAVAGRNRSYK